MRALLCACVLNLVLTLHGGSALEKRSRHYEKLATTCNDATVGIYCDTNDYMSFYGTGVLISPDGYILTSTTVVPPKATNIKVYMTNHRQLDAKLVEYSLPVESALLKVTSAAPLPHLPVAGKLPSVGERAYTLGNAHNMIRLGEHTSFSVGNISGIYPVKSIDTQSSYSGLAIETDAAINPGQDGGPLLNSGGQVTGIVSLSYSEVRWQGVAVPLTLIRQKLKHFTDKKIPISEKPLVTPLHGDGPTGRGLAGHARGIAQAIVKVNVERKYPPERMPRTDVESYLKTLTVFDSFRTAVKRELVGLFYLIDQLLATNQQVRRPGAPCTGLCISPNGYILTSTFNVAEDAVWKHKKKGIVLPSFSMNVRSLAQFDKKDYIRVPNRITKISVTLKNGRELSAKLVARHYPTGVALLKVAAADVPYIDLEQRVKKPQIGEACGVIGVAPGAIDYTLNTGIISADQRYRKHRFQYDAIINYGNSGGPIIGNGGEIYGIAISPMYPGPTMGRIYDSSSILRWTIAPNSGVSFAGQLHLVLAALPDLKKGKTSNLIKGAYVGFSPDRKALLDKRVRIDYIQKKSPAAKAGFRKGDVVLQFNNKQIESWRDITDEIDLLSPGDVVDVVVLRQGRQQYVEIDGKRIRSSKDLRRLMDKMKHGEAFTGRYVDVSNETLTLRLKLGQRR